MGIKNTSGHSSFCQTFLGTSRPLGPTEAVGPAFHKVSVHTAWMSHSLGEINHLRLAVCEVCSLATPWMWFATYHTIECLDGSFLIICTNKQGYFHTHVDDVWLLKPWYIPGLQTSLHWEASLRVQWHDSLNNRPYLRPQQDSSWIYQRFWTVGTHLGHDVSALFQGPYFVKREDCFSGSSLITFLPLQLVLEGVRVSSPSFPPTARFVISREM